MEPDAVANQFFKTLMQTQCHVCWRMLSKKTQETFLDWAMQDIYKRNPEAAQASKIAKPEVRLLFENNDATLLKTFWKHFFHTSHAEHFFRFAYYETTDVSGNQATVQVLFKYPDGRTAQVNLTMIKEGAQWKFGYVESGLPL